VHFSTLDWRAIEKKKKGGPGESEGRAQPRTSYLIKTNRNGETPAWAKRHVTRLTQPSAETEAPARKSGTKSPFPVPLACTGTRRDPATCGTNQAARKRRFGPTLSPDLIRTSVEDKYSGTTKIIKHLDHVSHCKTASGTNWSNRWTYQVLIDSGLVGGGTQDKKMSKAL